MASSPSRKCSSTPAVAQSESASQVDPSQSSPASSPVLFGRVLADPTLMTPDERQAAFGLLWARALARRRARQASSDCTNVRQKQKRN